MRNSGNDFILNVFRFIHLSIEEPAWLAILDYVEYIKYIKSY